MESSDSWDSDIEDSFEPFVPSDTPTPSAPCALRPLLVTRRRSRARLRRAARDLKRRHREATVPLVSIPIPNGTPTMTTQAPEAILDCILSAFVVAPRLSQHR